MMDWPNLLILDVGHGSCALLAHKHSAVAIDCAPGSVLIEALQQLGIHVIDTAIISHADHDHIGGLMALLTNPDIRVREIYLNSDSLKGTSTWDTLRCALRDARQRAETSVFVGLTTTQSENFHFDKVQVEILAPTPEIAMSGVGGHDLKGRELTVHSMCTVVCIAHNTRRIALFLGDIDQVGLDNLLDEKRNINAEILVFPHHGGMPGEVDAEEFARQLCTYVSPKLVVFSNGRGKFGNPREEIVRGIKAVAPDAHILCTQLSHNCAKVVPSTELAHLTDLPAKGRSNNSCCGGTVVVRLGEAGMTYDPHKNRHQEFVSNTTLVTSPLCLRLFPS